MKPERKKPVDNQSRLNVLYNINRELAQDLSLKQTLSNVLKKSVEAVAAERGSLLTLDENHTPLDAAIFYHGKFIQHTTTQLQTLLSHGLAGWVLQEEKPVLIPDTSKDDRWFRRPDDALDRSGAKCAICVPLISRNEIVGILTIVHSRPGFFTPDHLDLIQTIGDLAGSAIYNSRLYTRLEQAQERYQTLFEASSDLLFITDWDGRVIEINRTAEKVTEYKPRFSHNSSIMDFHRPDFGRLGPGFSNLKNTDFVVYESELLPSSSRGLPVEVKVAQVIIGKQSYLQWVLRDISERKQLASIKEDLMTMVYHDIRSPLSNVISSLEILNHQLQKTKNNNVKTILSVAHRSAERIMRLVNSLLDIRNIEDRGSILHSEIDSPLQIVADAVDICKPMATSKRVNIETVLPKKVPDISVDRDMIRRVLINLLENAIKFSPSNNSVIVRMQQELEEIQFSVEDYGTGIPPAQLEIVFNKFTRLRTDTLTRGFGLGLSFCKLAVEAHGGRIWAENRARTGSRFYFTIPVTKSPVPTA